MDQSDHKHGEIAWWRSRGIDDPFALAIRYYNRYRREHPDAPPPREKRRTVKPIKGNLRPRRKAKIASRGFDTTVKRKIPSRPFRRPPP